nr:MFS transporter [Virgibacillus ihumii]
MLLTGLSNSPELFGLCRFITGLGLGGVMPNVIGLISDYSPKGTRSRMIATIMAGYSIGGILAATLSIVIIPNFGWQSVFFFGALPLLFLPFLARSLPDSAGSLIARKEYKKLREILEKVNASYNPANDEQFVVSHAEKSSSTVKSLFSENRAFSTIMLWVTYFMSLIMIYGLTTWLPKFMNEAGYSLGSSLGFLVSLNIGATVGAILMGWVADSWGVKKSLIMFYLVAAITITGFGFTTNMVFLYLLVAIAGATTIGSQNLANSYVSQYYPASMRSTGLGWALGIGRIGGILGPTIGGILLASSLSLQFSFMIFALASVIAALAVYLTNREPNKSAITDLQEESTS